MIWNISQVPSCLAALGSAATSSLSVFVLLLLLLVLLMSFSFCCAATQCCAAVYNTFLRPPFANRFPEGGLPAASEREAFLVAACIGFALILRNEMRLGCSPPEPNLYSRRVGWGLPTSFARIFVKKR